MELYWSNQNKTRIENLQGFDCSCNKISVIENLPTYLQKFYCSG
jgi:hypothetical protein